METSVSCMWPKKRKQPFRDVNFRDGCDHLFNVHLSFQEMRWVGGLPLISQVPWNFPDPLISFVSHPWGRGTVLKEALCSAGNANSPKGSTMQCWKCKYMLKCFSNGSCDAQHGHKGLRDFSPISGRKRSAISESAFNMSVAIGRLSEKRANKLLKKKRKVKRMFMICCCVT